MNITLLRVRSNGEAGEAGKWVSDLWIPWSVSCVMYIDPHPSRRWHGAMATLKVIRHSAMIDRVVTFEQPSLRIGPALTRSEFLTADWAQGAADSGVREPQHSWRLCRQYRSMSLPFVVILRFEGERLTMLNLSLPYWHILGGLFGRDRAATRGKP